MEQEVYICSCGKKFNNSQSFNGHKAHCKIHNLQKYNNLNKLEETEIKRKESFKATWESKKKNLIENNLKNKEQFLQNWVSEQHRCESCGKIMTEYFGSGRFCSRSCANKHKYSQETKDKIKLSLIDYYNKNITHNNKKLELSYISKSNKYCIICGKKLFNKNKSGYCKDCLWHAEELKELSGMK